MSLVSTRYLIGAGVSLFGMTAICLRLYPDILQHYDYGVSYFGSVRATFVPYYLGFALTIIFITLAARTIQKHNKYLSMSLWSMSGCLTGVAATSYSLNNTAYVTHWVFAILLIVCILATALWLVWRGGLSRLDHILVTVITSTVIISILPIIHRIPIARVYIPRELLIFACALWLFGRAASSNKHLSP